MSISLKPEHVKRYRSIAALLMKYGRSDLVRDIGLADALDDEPRPPLGQPDEAPPPEALELASDLEGMGPTFVKLGQLLSTRTDLLPAPYLDALSRLQDHCTVIPFSEIREIVESELRVRLSNAFAHFDETPLAAASLGQVHRAELRDGRAVAVKVQRPGIRSTINDDLAALDELAGFLDRRTDVGRRFGFSQMFHEFRRSMMEELDYRREADNLRVLGHNLAKYDRIVVPQPVDDYTTSRVLTMELVSGRKVTSLGPLALMEVEGEAIAQQLFEAYLQQILVDGFFHADPHPGNVFLTDDGRLALIDLGMVARVAPEMQDELVKLLLAVGNGDGNDAADVAMGLGEQREDFDKEEFVRRISDLVSKNRGVAVDDLGTGSIVAELARISGECGLRPAPELTMLGKALLNLDQVSRTLDPDFRPDEKVRDQAASILRHRMMQAATPSSIFGAAMEAKEFAEKLPGRVNKVMDALAEGTITLNIQGIDERQLMRSAQKLGNRVTAGLVLSALIVGAAMLMRIQTSWHLFGYPGLAIICFLIAAVGSLGLLVTIFLADRRGP